MTDETLPQILADQMRREILRGELAPGAPVKEREQAATRDVSRTPMREAIRLLANEGLVQLRPSRSPIVANPSFDEIRNDLEVLTALELLSGELACERASAADIATIRALHEELAEAFDIVDPIDAFEIDMRFHVAMVDAANNAALAETHRSYLRRLWRVRFLSASRLRARERVLRQHGAMVEGLERRDAKRVRRQIEAHVGSLLANVRSLFEAEEAARQPQSKTAASNELIRS
ncbi:MAG: GntR family transcriptional regulator [Pseudomonadota bacterium]